MREKEYEAARSSANAGIEAIRNSDESPERKIELIRDFENYIAELDKLGKN